MNSNSILNKGKDEHEKAPNAKSALLAVRKRNFTFYKDPQLIELHGKLKYISRVRVLFERNSVVGIDGVADKSLEFAIQIQDIKYIKFHHEDFPELFREIQSQIIANPPANCVFLLSLIEYVKFDWYMNKDQGQLGAAFDCVQKAKELLQHAVPSAWTADVYVIETNLNLSLAMCFPKFAEDYTKKAFESCANTRDHYLRSQCDQQEILPKSIRYLCMMINMVLRIPIYQLLLQEKYIYPIWDPAKIKMNQELCQAKIELAEELLKSADLSLRLCSENTLENWPYASEYLIHNSRIYLNIRKTEFYIRQCCYKDAFKYLDLANKCCCEFLEKGTGPTNFSRFLLQMTETETKSHIDKLYKELEMSQTKRVAFEIKEMIDSDSIRDTDDVQVCIPTKGYDSVESDVIL